MIAAINIPIIKINWNNKKIENVKRNQLFLASGEKEASKFF